MDALVEQLNRAFVESTQTRFNNRKTVLSFNEYLQIVSQNPLRHLRNSAQYFSQVIQHFSSYRVDLPTGSFTRYKVFDALFDQGEGQVMGHEHVQEELVKLVNNFVRAGKIDRLILLHGPNGTAKTSLIQALVRAAELFSETDEGPLYRFNWVFPLKTVVKGALGFSSPTDAQSESYAHLNFNQIECKIPCEQKDHPLLLLNTEYRDILFKQLFENKSLPEGYPIPDVLRKGELSPKNKKIFDALLTSYQGNVQEVLKHIQVERFYLSRRYRLGIASVEPQMSVDAYARQVTMDQSLGSLPSALQHLSLFEAGGALSDANRGLIEYNDLLKRPIESWKYLLVATEQGHASLDVLSLFLDTLMIASSNELHLSSFKEYPDWQSFKGRFELIRVPYLLRFSDELRIYQNQIPKSLSGLHIAPHSLEIAAKWAVLTRMEPPRYDRYDENTRDLIQTLTPLEKLELYDTGTVPERLSQKEARDIKKAIPDLYKEYQNDLEYEGRHGASPREIRVLLLNAAQDPRFDHLSPLSVLDQIRSLVKDHSSYEFLRREPVRGYRDAISFINAVHKNYLEKLEEEIQAAVGLLKADSHREIFERYVKHVSAWTKKEKLPNAVTGKPMDPDLGLMTQIERVLLAKLESPEEFRRSLISQIGAFRLEHPDEPVDYHLLFGTYLKRLKEDYYNEQRKAIEHVQNCFLKIINGDTDHIDEKDKEQVKVMQSNLKNLGYNDSSARQAIAHLLKHR